MLNEIIKTAEELNTAALYYRQSGNMDGVRELAKAHAVSLRREIFASRSANKSEQSFIRASGEVATSQSFSLVR